MPLDDIFAMFRWWLVLLVLGGAATPLTYHLLKQLPDRGYAFTKMLGLLIVSYLFWLCGSLGILSNELGSIVLSLILLLLLSGWAYLSNGDDLRQWLFQNWRYLLIVEVIFAAAFFFWVWVRTQNPAITGTEKPMEFAFLNAIGRSPTLPPHDPWLSNFAISYYYFGYVMTSVLTRLAVLPEYIAFNLGIAWLAAGTSIGAFGLVYNLTSISKKRIQDGIVTLHRSSLFLGLMAAVALPIAGNLEIVLEILHANGIGSPQFWTWLDIRNLNTPPTGDGFGSTGPRFWWWWRSSRVIHEYHLSGVPETGLEPITEVPSFSFILGDLHPHVLSLPFAFVSLGVALWWWLRPIHITESAWTESNWAKRLQLLVNQIGPSTLILTSLILGGLSFLNTWDVLIHLFIIVAAFGLSQWARHQWQPYLLIQTMIVSVILIVGAILLYLPFYVGFRSQAGAPYLLPMLMRPTRLPHFLTIFGMPLWSITLLLVVLGLKQKFSRWRVGLQTAVYLISSLLVLMLCLSLIVASSEAGASRVSNLANELNIGLPERPPEGIALGWGVTAVGHLLPKVMIAKLTSPGVPILLTLLISLTMMIWVHHFQSPHHQDEQPSPPSRPILPFALLLILTGALLTLGPEFLYLQDFFGVRLNTVFKFYYQAWILFGIAAIFALDYLWHHFRPGAALAAVGYGGLLAASLLFPLYAISSRAAEYSAPPTLNGIDHYLQQNPGEYDALLWLRQNIEGTRVIVEAVGGSYSPEGHGRVSATTGLPTVLGWPFHELQWRGTTEGWNERESDVVTIYTGSWEETKALLDRYQVELIYVGPLELNTYGTQIQEKFERNLQKAYADGDITIYWWSPS